MRKAFEIIDHTADVGIVAYGADLAELFSNAALALFSLIIQPESVKEKLHRRLEVSSKDQDNLLVNWLNELIYVFDAERMLFRRFDVDSLTENSLRATCHGEMFDPVRHTIKIGVKAATYHMLTVERNGGGYKARVIFDI